MIEEQVKVQTKNTEVYTNIIKELITRKPEFHIYKPKQKRSFRVVLKNMHSSTNMEDIKQAINDLGHEVTNIYAKYYVTKKPLPLFFIELKQTHNNKDIYKLKTLLRCRIYFEAPRPKRVCSKSSCGQE